MRFDLNSVRWLLMGSAVCLGVAGCGSKLKWRVMGPLDAQTPSVGSLRIDAIAVDTTELEKDHPFRWRGSEAAGFMLFDVKITNTGTRDLLCQMGHLDFPGVVSPDLTLGHFLEGAVNAMHLSGDRELIGTDDLKLTAVAHETATMLMGDGYRYQILGHGDFCQRYMYLYQKEMRRARGSAFIPYVGGFVMAGQMRKAGERMSERLMHARQMVMRPGVVPAGSTIRGYLVFAWPPEPQPGTLTLRLPVQPGHVASVRFELARRD